MVVETTSAPVRYLDVCITNQDLRFFLIIQKDPIRESHTCTSSTTITSHVQASRVSPAPNHFTHKSLVST